MLTNKCRFYVLLAMCVLLGSCAGLDESAQDVKYSTKSEAPKNCTEIGEVSAGSMFALYDMESVKNAMRNKTSKMGGNFLVIDDIKTVSSAVPGANGSAGNVTSGYRGTGRAYHCPQGQ